MADYPSIFDMRFDVAEFAHATYGVNLPEHTSDADVKLLYVTSDRISRFQNMAEVAKTQEERELYTALHDDYQMLFYGALHAIDTASDEIASLRKQLAEKNATRGLRNIDSYSTYTEAS